MAAYFKEGDLVKILGSELIGQIVKIIGQNKIRINFEYLEVTVSSSQVQAISTTMQSILINKMYGCQTARILNFNQADFSAFRTEIDLHGMYVKEALDALDKWLDKASLLEHKRLRIIHGIGKGILRQEIRTYLSSHVLVKKIIKQAPLQGGSGVTMVELY